MKKKLLALLIFALMCLTGCDGGTIEEEEEDKSGAGSKPKKSSMAVENVTVEIDGLESEYTFVYVSDLHIIVKNEEISEEHVATVDQRIVSFSEKIGMTPAELWETLPAELDAYEADGILFGGDMLDYASTSNLECLKRGLDSLKTPYLFVRADHDYANWYNNLDMAYVKDLHAQIDGANEVSLLEFPDLCVVGLDNTTSNITDSALARFKEIYALGKPIVLLTHVPIASQVDLSLSEESKKVWQDRALIWGHGCYYEPNAATGELLQMIYAEDSLVKEVLAGHLHFSWDGQLTPTTGEHVFAPAVDGSIGVITVKGTNENQ